jgi:large subunit ribosomal protein L34
MSFTYKPKKRKRAKTHGFLVRMKTPGGKKALSRRRAKGRKRIVVKTRRA